MVSTQAQEEIVIVPITSRVITCKDICLTFPLLNLSNWRKRKGRKEAGGRGEEVGG